MAVLPVWLLRYVTSCIVGSSFYHRSMNLGVDLFGYLDGNAVCGSRTPRGCWFLPYLSTLWWQTLINLKYASI